MSDTPTDTTPDPANTCSPFLPRPGDPLPALRQPGDPAPDPGDGTADGSLTAMLSTISGILKVVAGVLVAHGRWTQSDAEAMAALSPLVISLVLGVVNWWINRKAHATVAAYRAVAAAK